MNNTTFLSGFYPVPNPCVNGTIHNREALGNGGYKPFDLNSTCNLESSVLVPYTNATMSIIYDLFGFVKINSAQAVSYMLYHNIKWTSPIRPADGDQLAFWSSYLNWNDTAPGTDSWENI